VRLKNQTPSTTHTHNIQQTPTTNRHKQNELHERPHVVSRFVSGKFVPVDELVLPPVAVDPVDELIGDVAGVAPGGEESEEEEPNQVVPADVGIAADTFRPATVRGCTVMFDHYSHASGIQRGYIRCSRHDRCFRYAQVNRFVTRTRLCANLFAWRALGESLDREGHQSKDCQPDQLVVTALEGDVIL
jgi:hypothetical protein